MCSTNKVDNSTHETHEANFDFRISKPYTYVQLSDSEIKQMQHLSRQMKIRLTKSK